LPACLGRSWPSRLDLDDLDLEVLGLDDLSPLPWERRIISSPRR
jgi:hypothetical protein